MTKLVVIIGDSNTCCGADSKRKWGAELAKLLPTDFEVLCLGRSGATAATGNNSYARSRQMEEVRELKEDSAHYIVVALGANDKSEDVFSKGLSSLVQSLRSRFPSSVIYLLPPFHEKVTDELIAASSRLATHRRKADTKFIELKLESGHFSDRKHLNVSGQVYVAEKVAGALLFTGGARLLENRSNVASSAPDGHTVADVTDGSQPRGRYAVSLPTITKRMREEHPATCLKLDAYKKEVDRLRKIGKTGNVKSKLLIRSQKAKFREAHANALKKSVR